MRVGIVLPSTEMEHDAGAIQEWTQATERMGFDHIVIYDHVVGANPASRPGWTMPYDIDSAFYDPFALIPFMGAFTKTIEFFTGVLILPQRQAVLVAKQAACADLLCNGRLRLGIGTGWNAVEYEALGVPWSERGKIFEDQVEVLRQLWTKRAVTLKTPYHTITDAGILPMPVQQPIPLWFGGGGREPLTGKQSPERVLRRMARLADGIVAAAPDPDEYILEMLSRFRAFCREYGRDPAKIGLEGYGGVSKDTLHTLAARAKAWEGAGATHIGVNATRDGLNGIHAHLRRQEEVAKILGLRARP